MSNSTFFCRHLLHCVLEKYGRGAPKNIIWLKCFTNGNKIDSAFSVSFLVISRHFTVIFIITLIDKVSGNKYNGTALLGYINIIVDWAVAYPGSLLTHMDSKWAFPLLSLLILDQLSLQGFLLYTRRISIKQSATLLTPLRLRTT